MEERRSKFNGEIKVIKSLGFGTYIQANGLTQSGGIVETIWRQTLKMLNAKKINAKSVLILGLGGGTVAKLIRKKWPEAKITGVDMDPIMVELGKKYLGLNETGVNIKIADASTYHLKPRTCDLVIIDLYNGDKFPKKFESENYIQLVRSLLASSGVAIFNRLYYGEKRKEAVKFGEKLKKIFKNVDYFFPEANLMLICYNS